MSLGGPMKFSILYTTGDSWTISKTFGHGPIHCPYSLTSSLKLNKRISATGDASMRRRRSLHPENLPPPSRRLPIRNPSPACLPNPASPPDPHHCQLPAKLLQPCRPRRERWLRQLTPTKTCPLSSDRMVNSFLKRRNAGRNSAFAFITVSRTIALLPALISPALQRWINWPALPTHPSPRCHIPCHSIYSFSFISIHSHSFPFILLFVPVPRTFSGHGLLCSCSRSLWTLVLHLGPCPRHVP